MSVTVLVADNAEIIRRAIRGLLTDWPEIELVGEAADFAQAIQMVNDLKPRVMVMELHMAEARPPIVNGHLHLGTTQLLAMSLANDEEAKCLAESFGAARLLDKMYLSEELVPAILQLAGAERRIAVGENNAPTRITRSSGNTRH